MVNILLPPSDASDADRKCTLPDALAPVISLRERPALTCDGSWSWDSAIAQQPAIGIRANDDEAKPIETGIARSAAERLAQQLQPDDAADD